MSKDKAVLYPFFEQWLKGKLHAGQSTQVENGIPAEDVAYLIEKIISARSPNARYFHSFLGCRCSIIIPLPRYMIGMEAWKSRLVQLLPTALQDWVLFTHYAQSTA